jgi:drug/metabolite transporter (DMT)-like permease
VDLPEPGSCCAAADWAAVAYLAVMVTVVAFVLWYSTLSR